MPTSSSPSGPRPGDPVLVRSVYGGRVRWTFPHRFVGVDDGRLVLYRGVGAQGKWMGRDEDGRYLERWVCGDPPRDPGWYVNLQAPLERTALGFDTTDWALDILVEPNGGWRWKDEEDFAEAIALGVLDEPAAAAVRPEGARVVAARPWPTGWEDRRPPADWAPLPLPAGWDDV